jgi:hypothetical protein
MNIIRKLIRFFWLQELGHSKVMARVYSPLSQAAMFFTFLKVYGVALNYWLMASLVLAWFLLSALFGFIYTKLDLLKFETELSNENNPMLREIHKKMG